MSDGTRVDMQFSAGVWTEVLDVVAEDGLTWRRGIDGKGPNDRVNGPGTAALSLANDAGNSGGAQGYYSPGHPSARAGFGIGTPMRIVYVRDGVDHVRWRGKLAAIDPMPGVAGQQRVRCQATSTTSDLVEEKIRAIAPQLNQTEVQLLAAIIAALPTNSQPPATDFDEALDTYTFAFDDLSSGTAALTVVKRVMDSAQGYYFETGDGTHRYVSRVSRALALSRFAFTDDHLDRETGLSRPTTLDGAVYNRVRLQTHAKAVSATNTEVLFAHQGSLELAAGESTSFFVDYQDQTSRQKMGGTNFQDPPEAGVDYVFNAASDGSGADVTADISVTFDFFASTCKVTIENTGAVTAYKQTLQGRGQSIQDLSPVWAEAFSAETYGTRTIEIDLAYQSDVRVAQVEAEFLQTHYRNLADQIDAIEFLADASEDALTQAVEREIGDVVTVSELVTGTTLIDGYIQWIEWTVAPAGLVTCRFGLAPRVERQVPSDEAITVTDDLAVASDPPETRIDFADIDFSEVA